VLENIFRFVEEKKLSPFDAARDATAEIALPVLATTLCLVVIFIPVSFMSSISGRFLYQFGLTAAVAILVSLLVSFTLTPMMSARLFRQQDLEAEHAASRRGFYRHIDDFYARSLAWALRHRAAVALLACAVVIGGYPAYRLVRQEFVPSDVDEAEFEVYVTAPEGTSAAAMDDIMRAVEADVRAVPGVTTMLAAVGGMYNGAVNEGHAYVRIAPHHQRIFVRRPLPQECDHPAAVGSVSGQLHAA
jgi:hydrophobic/amphiphilic exporter-1 (mainly G- bacteria), HAE1 family